MEALIDKTYFVDERKITGLSQYDADEESVLTRFINKYQKEYLARMFGKTLSLTLPTEITDLLFDADLLTSPIADYVYYKWQRYKASVTTNAGTKVLQTQGTKSVSPREKMVDAWNDMVKFNRELYDSLELRETIPYQKTVGNVTTTENIIFSTDIAPNVDMKDEIFCYINTFDI